jgi:hypothetical protein
METVALVGSLPSDGRRKEKKRSNELNVISLLGTDLNQETTVYRATSQVGKVK